MYDNVMKWDDSAGEEAFSIAKKRFWAQMHGYSCDHLPLPDPDLCIDQIDYDQVIHPELIADLEADPVEEDHDPVVIFGDALYADHPLPPMGWGDEDEFPVPVEYGFENAPADYGAPWDQTGGNSGNESGQDDDWGYWNYGGAGLQGEIVFSYVLVLCTDFSCLHLLSLWLKFMRIQDFIASLTS